MQKDIDYLCSRIGILEDYFDRPNLTLKDSDFQRWILKYFWANQDSVRRDLLLFMGHLGYTLTTYTQRTIVEEIKPKKEKKQ